MSHTQAREPQLIDLIPDGEQAQTCQRQRRRPVPHHTIAQDNDQPTVNVSLVGRVQMKPIVNKAPCRISRVSCPKIRELANAPAGLPTATAE